MSTTLQTGLPRLEGRHAGRANAADKLLQDGEQPGTGGIEQVRPHGEHVVDMRRTGSHEAIPRGNALRAHVGEHSAAHVEGRAVEGVRAAAANDLDVVAATVGEDDAALLDQRPQAHVGEHSAAHVEGRAVEGVRAAAANDLDVVAATVGEDDAALLDQRPQLLPCRHAVEWVLGAAARGVRATEQTAVIDEPLHVRVYVPPQPIEAREPGVAGVERRDGLALVARGVRATEQTAVIDEPLHVRVYVPPQPIEAREPGVAGVERRDGLALVVGLEPGAAPRLNTAATWTGR